MKKHFLKILFFISASLIGAVSFHGYAQRQDFERDFQPQSFPEEFVPGWFGNEVRASSARIFQIANQGRNSSRALAVQPISSFDGKIWVRLAPASFENPELVFYAKTLQNGSGNRPALVFCSWGESLEGAFTEPIQIGSAEEFANENRDFKRYSIDLPDNYKSSNEVYLSFDIRYGPGTGSAARWVMDDFEFGDLVRDMIPPSVLEVKGYGSNAISVQFSEKVDPVFSILNLAYELDGENPEEVLMNNDSLTVLSFDQNLESSRSYSLLVRQIPDLEGNFLRDTTINFTFFDPTDIAEKSLVINEIMPAPRADMDLPNVEFIEIFNAAENEFRLSGVQLSNSRSTTLLGEYWVQPGEYLILAPESQAEQFSDFGNVLPVRSWPTLLNSGDQISLKSGDGILIDQITYSTSSWGGSEYANGGYSLEVPNPFYLCDNTSQLRSSRDEARGTPGVQNSVFDPSDSIQPPELKAGFFRDSLTIFVEFSSPFLINPSVEHVVADPSLEVESLIFPSANQLSISLKSPAKSNQTYQIEIRGIQDCLGNEIPNQFFSIVLPDLPRFGDLIINEVLFNPRTGDPKFVEIKNTSHRFLNLEGWALANRNSAGDADQKRIFGSQGLVLPPQSYLAITTDLNALKLGYPKSAQGNLLQIPSLPSYPIGGGTVILINQSGEVAEFLEYDENLHHPLLRDPKGVSLERISDNLPATLRSNWQSSSGNEDYATPGRKNSQSLEAEFESNLIQIDPEIFDPEGSSGVAFTSIRYELSSPGWVGTVKIYSSAGQLIQTLAQNQILGTTGLFTWQGTDSTGKLVRAGYYVLVAELYEPEGGVKVIKKTIVVATRL